jgi:hypothetical protein
MRRVIVSALVTSAIVAGLGTVLNLNHDGLQLLMFPGVVVCCLFVLWPEMRPSISERRRNRRL